MISTIISFFDRTLFPRSCFICKEESPLSLCENCLRSFAKSYETPSPFITSMYSYKDRRIKRIIHAIKYFHRKDLIVPLAMHTKGKMDILPNFSNSYALIPIPMPRLRRYIRGYNHAEELAKQLSLLTKIPLRSDVLARPSLTRRQVMTKTRHERLKNQHNTFVLKNPIDKSTTVFLIDDVTTTGATLHEARKLLLGIGVERVFAYTIAH